MIRKWAAALLILALTAGLGGCKSGTGIRFTTGLTENELFQVEDEVCTRQEAMVFVLTQKKIYEGTYGTQIWSAGVRGQEFDAYMKDRLQDFLARMKCMVLMAKNDGVVLEEQEEKEVEAAAQEYYVSIPAQTASAVGITQEHVQKVFHDYRTADKLMSSLTQDVKTEISEDEARVIQVRQIFLSTSGLDPDAKNEKRKLAEEIRGQAVAGTDFSMLASKYNESDAYELQVARGDTEAQFEKAAFALSKDEISEVVETAYGVHIIKCLNNYDEQQTAEHKRKMLRDLRTEKFYEYYDAFEKNVVAQYNKKAWEKLDYREELILPELDFYEVYGNHFEENGF